MSDGISSKTLFLGGTLVLAGVWLGWWLALRRQAAPALVQSTKTQVSALSAPPPARKKVMPPSAQPAGLVSTLVESSGAKILEQSSDRARRVLVATTQPVRISPQGSVRDSPDSGLPVMPGDQPTSLGVLPPGQELYAAIPAGGVPAMVTLWLQEV